MENKSKTKTILKNYVTSFFEEKNVYLLKRKPNFS